MTSELDVGVEPIAGNFAYKDIVSVNQFEAADIKRLFEETEDMAEMAREERKSDLLDDLTIANLFYQPSTRTFLSFEAAAKRLGATTISTQGVEYSSISKGETLEDTLRTVERYADTITLRHPDKGSASRAAYISDKPVINGGDGTGEHPTQALLDLYTIESSFEPISGLTVTLLGDLKHGRTVHSLARLLAMYDVTLNYVAPEKLAMPDELREELAGKVEQNVTHDIHEVISESDVLYVTRVQREYFDPEEYERHKGAYVVDEAVMAQAKREMILMHPLPRVDEIHPSLDHDPRSVYFDQVENGMYIRMALLALINGRSISDS